MNIPNAPSSRFLLGVLLLFLISNTTSAQLYNIDEGYLVNFHGADPIENTLIFSAPFLRKPTDARSGGIGNSGIASSTDVNAMFFNASKLAFSDTKLGMAINAAPMFYQLGLGDRIATSLSAFKIVGDKNTLGLDLRFSSAGRTTSHTAGPIFSGSLVAKEALIALAYVRKWTANFSSAVTTKYISSNIGYSYNSYFKDGIELIPGKAIAVDFSSTYCRPFNIGNRSSNLMLGFSITNLGSQISYSNDLMKEYLPANIGLGAGWALDYNKKSSIAFMADINKLLVPTPNPCSGLLCSDARNHSSARVAWRSFYDADGGFSEELAEFYYAVGIEYDYMDKYFLRTGYFYEHASKGNVQTLTFGIGYKFRRATLDFSRHVPLVEKEILVNRYRFSMSYEIPTKKNQVSPD